MIIFVALLPTASSSEARHGTADLVTRRRVGRIAPTPVANLTPCAGRSIHRGRGGGTVDAPVPKMAIWTNRTDGWNRSSDDSWDEPATPVRHFTRRALLARSLGAVGVLATLALAVAAFAPRIHDAANRFEALAGRVVLPWDPPLNPGPEAMALDRGPGRLPPEPAISTGPPSEGARQVGSLAPKSAEETPVSPPATPPEAATAVAAVTADVAPIPPPAVTAPPAKEAPAPPVREAPAAVTSPPREPQWALPVSNFQPREEPTLTHEEIEMRKERYERWLKNQGLERIH